MFTLAARGSYQEEIRKSRFHAIARPVAHIEAAMAFFATESDPLATHNCWAYRIGQLYRFNDDGEPSGTAGKPILQAIDSLACDHVAVLVIRWFGGIKLGPGGLMRAYGGSAAHCLREAERVEMIEMVEATCECSFHDLARIRQRLDAAGAVIRTERYSALGVYIEVGLPKAQEPTVRLALGDISRGKAIFTTR